MILKRARNLPSHSGKRITTTIMAILMSLTLLAGCGSNTASTTVNGTAATAGTVAVTKVSTTAGTAASTHAAASTAASIPEITYKANDTDTAWSSSSAAATITLNGSTASVSGTGASVAGNTINIIAGGTYILKGTLTDGQIAIATKDDAAVRLVLDNANITSSSAAPIQVLKGDKLVILLAEGTTNQITDARTAIGESDPDAAIYSKADLTINGTGALTVAATTGHGLVSKDALKIVSGTLTVNAAKDALQGQEYVAMKEGTVTLTAGSDGIQASDSKKADKGNVVIAGGTLTITAVHDGIQSSGSVSVLAGELNITTGGGSANAVVKMGDPGGFQNNTSSTTAESGTSDSAKGIKAKTDITVAGGFLTIDSSDDALHAANTLTLQEGTFKLSAGDDGIHSDNTVVINSGKVAILTSYEGIEGSNISVNGGDISLNTLDDGFNVSGGNDSSASGNALGGQDSFAVTDGVLDIRGGSILVNAAGDGLDSNGSISMSGGTVIVNGPTQNMNGAIDYNGTCQLTGGTLLAVGSAGMAQAPGETSTQNSILVNLDSGITAGTWIHVQDADGKTILTYKTTKDSQSIVLSSPDLKTGSTYTVYTGGTVTESGTNLLNAGTWSGGTQVASLTLSSVVTTYGSTGGMGGPGGGMGGPGGGHGGGFNRTPPGGAPGTTTQGTSGTN